MRNRSVRSWSVTTTPAAPSPPRSMRSEISTGSVLPPRRRSSTGLIVWPARASGSARAQGSWAHPSPCSTVCQGVPGSSDRRRWTSCDAARLPKLTSPAASMPRTPSARESNTTSVRSRSSASSAWSSVGSVLSSRTRTTKAAPAAVVPDTVTSAGKRVPSSRTPAWTVRRPLWFAASSARRPCPARSSGLRVGSRSVSVRPCRSSSAAPNSRCAPAFAHEIGCPGRASSMATGASSSSRRSSAVARARRPSPPAVNCGAGSGTGEG